MHAQIKKHTVTATVTALAMGCDALELHPHILDQAAWNTSLGQALLGYAHNVLQDVTCDIQLWGCYASVTGPGPGGDICPASTPWSLT